MAALVDADLRDAAQDAAAQLPLSDRLRQMVRDSGNGELINGLLGDDNAQQRAEQEQGASRVTCPCFVQSAAGVFLFFGRNRLSDVCILQIMTINKRKPHRMATTTKCPVLHFVVRGVRLCGSCSPLSLAVMIKCDVVCRVVLL